MTGNFVQEYEHVAKIALGGFMVSGVITTALGKILSDNIRKNSISIEMLENKRKKLLGEDIGSETTELIESEDTEKLHR